jgi:3-deoxy-D-manno-octulosonate 8-phosphate phosphatase (KDO 8-P phosphatase)
VELKRFDIQDNVGIWLLREAGILVVIVSGRVSPATVRRAEELGIDDVVQDDLARKLPAFEDILRRYGVRMEEAAFLGDDLPDLPVLARVALPVAVANAVTEVRAVAQYVTQRPGGEGAVREFAEVLLKARGEWEDRVNAYLADRGGAPGRVSHA